MSSKLLLNAFVAVFAFCGCVAAVDDQPSARIPLSIAASTDVDSRVSLGEGNHCLWNKGDSFVAFDGTSSSNFTLASGEGTTSGRFDGTISSSATFLYAAYPSAGSVSVEAGRASGLVMSASQSAVEGGFDPSAALMVAYSKDMKDVIFHHVSSFAKFTPQFDCSSVTIRSNDGSAIAGTVEVGIGSDGKPSSVSVVSAASSSVTLSGDIKAGKTYLIGLLPVSLEGGITIELLGLDGKKSSRTKASKVEFKSSVIYNLGSFSPSVEAESITLSRNASGVIQGKTLELSATVLPEGATGDVQWSSSDASVAAVSGGKVTALRAGICTVTASLGELSDSCVVTVVASSSAVSRLGYSQLTASERQAYDIILEAIIGFEANGKSLGDNTYNRAYLDFSSISQRPTAEQIMRLTSLIIRDVPEAFHVTNYIYRYDYDRGQYYVRLTNVYTPEKYASYMATIYEARDAILAEIPSGASDFQKAKSLHDSFLTRTHYGDVTGGNAGNIVGGLVNGRAVCEGYARTYLFLCQQAGLEAIYVSGCLQTSSENDTWVNHAWNHVCIDGTWYMCDLTSDGGLVGAFGYRYFLLGQTSATRIHRYTTTDGGDPNTDSRGYSSLPSLSEIDYKMDR